MSLAPHSGVDRLIPPPWSPARRLAGWATLLLAGLVVGSLWTSGLIVPNLVATGASGSAWEQGEVHDGRVTDVEVVLRYRIENRGWVAATVSGLEPPDTRGVDWRLDSGEPPAELAPGQTVDVELTGYVDDCAEVVGRGADRLVLRAQGPLPLTRSRSVGLPRAALADRWPLPHAATPKRPVEPRDPSWVYRALDGPCDPASAG